MRSGTRRRAAWHRRSSQGSALATSPPSCCARPSSTSGIGRVLCSGATAGGARLATVCNDPDSGTSSSQDSSGAWSGKIRSACALVSSMKLPKLTMYGILAMASRICAAGGAAENRIGVVKQQHLRRARAPPSVDCANALRLAKLPAALAMVLRHRSSGRLRREAQIGAWSRPASTSDSSAFTASALNSAIGVRQRRAADDRGRRSARVDLVREARDDRRAHAGLLLHRFRRVVRQARGPAGDQRAGARCPHPAARASRSGSHARCPAPARPPFPAGTAIHSSAFAPVCDMRDSTCTNFAAASRRAPGASRRNRSTAPPANSRCPGNPRQRRSHNPRGARSNVGSAAWPKLSRFACAQHGFVEGLVPNRRRRAKSLQEALDQFAALARAEAAQERPAIRRLRRLRACQDAKPIPSAHRPS